MSERTFIKMVVKDFCTWVNDPKH